MESKYAEQVAHGVEWLNEEVPGWHSRIDLDTLDMSNEKYCILGQLFQGAALLSDNVWETGFSWAWQFYGFDEPYVYNLGFDLRFGWSGSEWSALGAEWCRVIEELRNA